MRHHLFVYNRVSRVAALASNFFNGLSSCTIACDSDVHDTYSCKWIVYMLHHPHAVLTARQFRHPRSRPCRHGIGNELCHQSNGLVRWAHWGLSVVCVMVLARVFFVCLGFFRYLLFIIWSCCDICPLGFPVIDLGKPRWTTSACQVQDKRQYHNLEAQSSCCCCRSANRELTWVRGPSLCLAIWSSSASN